MRNVKIIGKSSFELELSPNPVNTILSPKIYTVAMVVEVDASSQLSKKFSSTFHVLKRILKPFIAYNNNKKKFQLQPIFIETSFNHTGSAVLFKV